MTADYTGNPGSLVVDWAKGSNPSESDFTTLVEIGDYNAMGYVVCSERRVGRLQELTIERWQ